MMKEINGRFYPLWSQFVERKDEWIGGLLQELGDSCGGGEEPPTEIIDISLEPLDDSDSAALYISGKDYGCGFNVQYGGISSATNTGKWLHFHVTGVGHRFRIIKKADR